MAPARPAAGPLAAGLLLLAGMAVATGAAAGPGEARLVAVGVPLGPAPEGWEDLEGMPIELRFRGIAKDWFAFEPGITLAFEVRPGGRLEWDFDGVPCLPWGLHSACDRCPQDAAVVLVSDPTAAAAVHPGREAPDLRIRIETAGEVRSLRRLSFDLAFVRLLEWKDTEIRLREGDSLATPAPPEGRFHASIGALEFLPVDEAEARRRSSSRTAAPLAPLGDLLRIRDAAGRSVRWSGMTFGVAGPRIEFGARGSPTGSIAFPVRMRFRQPIRWSERTYRFVIEGLDLSPTRAH